MSKFIKNKSKIAVALLSTLFCNNGGVSATGKLKKNSYNIPQTSSVNLDKSSKSAQTLGAVGGATSGNININNSNNNKIIEWVKGHKWQTAVGGLSVATVATLAILGVKFLGKKDDGGGGPKPEPKPKPDPKVPGQKKNNKEQTSEQLAQIAQENMNIIYNKIISNDQSLKKSLDNFKQEIINQSFNINNIVDYSQPGNYVDYGGKGIINKIGQKTKTAQLTEEIKQSLSAGIVKFFEDVFTGKKKLTQEQCKFISIEDVGNETFSDIISFSENNEKYSIEIGLNIKLVKYVYNNPKLEVNLQKQLVVGSKVLSSNQTGDQDQKISNAKNKLAFLFED